MLELATFLSEVEEICFYNIYIAEIITKKVKIQSYLIIFMLFHLKKIGYENICKKCTCGHG